MKYTLAAIIVLLLTSIGVKAQDIQFVGQAKSAVLSGEKFQLIYSLNEEGEDLRLPKLEGFSILMGPYVTESSSTQIINGKVSRSKQYTYTYILKCDTPGSYTIDPAQVTVDGKKYSSNSLNIEVVKNQGSTQTNTQEDQSSDDNNFSKDDLFITVTKNKSSVFIGEPVVLTTKIYTLINLDNISDIKHPDFRNFIVQDISTPQNMQWSYEIVNNKQYQVGTFEQKVLYAQKSGKIDIDPTEIEFLIKQRVRRTRSIFDDFFDNNYRMIKKRVKSKPLQIDVKPYPQPQPEGFIGGVGNFKMNVTSSLNQAKVNDGITIKIDISGIGNHKLIENPKLNIPTDFDTFDPTVKNNFTNTLSGMKGNKTLEYLIIPRFGGEYTIDPIKFSYLNPQTGQYVTLASEPIHISVAKSDNQEGNGNTYIPSAINREDVKFVGKDIRFIKTDKIKLFEKGVFFYGSLFFYLGYLGPLILLVIAYIVYRKRIHENANIQLVKNKKANKMAQKRLKKSAIYLSQNNHEAFYDEILKALYSYLSDKLFLPISELSKEKASELITSKGVSNEVKEELIEILDTCEFARFSPSSGESKEMDKLYKRALNNIGTLDSQIKI